MPETTKAPKAPGKPVLKSKYSLVVLNIVSITGLLFHCNILPAGLKAQKSSGISSNIYLRIILNHREASALLQHMKCANLFSVTSDWRVVDCGKGQQSMVNSLSKSSASSSTTATTLLVARTGFASYLILYIAFKNFVKSLNTAASMLARNTIKIKLDEL